MRIIGLELRVAHIGDTGFVKKEIGIVPCDIELEIDSMSSGANPQYEITIHTDLGDMTSPSFQGIYPLPSHPHIKHRQNR